MFACEQSDFSFSYTIGNQLKGLPELLVIGSCEASYLNDYSRLMIARGAPFDDGEVVALPKLRRPMKMIRTGAIAKQDTDEPGCQPPWSTFRAQ